MRPQAVHVAFGVTMAMVGAVTLAETALASCAPPRSLSENAQFADAVVYGEVLTTEGPRGRPGGGPLVVAVKRVLKGSVPQRIVVERGPRPSEPQAPGVFVATSVDYNAEPNTDHVLYLRQRPPAGFSTDACQGSHAGPPTAEESAFFGAGRDPDRWPTGVGGASDLARGIAALVLVSASIFAVAAITLALRRAPAASGGTPAG